MKNSRTYDVIIIGGGIAGLSAGYFLSSEAKILILEAENACGLHATGRSFKGLTYEYNFPSINALVKDSLPFFQQRTYASQNLLYQRGRLILSKETDEHYLYNQIKRAKALNIDLTILNFSEICQYVSTINPVYSRAIFDPFMFDLNINGLQSIFINKIIEKNHIRIGEIVSGLKYENNVWIVTTNKNSYQAPIIINAGGAWADSIAKLAALPLNLISFSRTVYISGVKTEKPIWNWPVISTITTNLIFKPNSSNTFIVSPGEEVLTKPEIPAANVQLIHQTKEDFNTITGLKLGLSHKKWAGLRTFSQDKLPIIGFDPRLDSFFWLAGLGGYGNKISPCLGKIAANLILHQNKDTNLKKTMCDASLFSPQRFLEGG